MLCFLAFYIFLSGYVPPLVRKSTEAGGNVAETGATNGERVACIDDNRSALLYRLRLIESAQSEIRLSAYSFYDDESGNDVICALFAAAERGVNVKIIVDGFNEGKLKNVAAFKALAAHENAEAKAYNHVGFFGFWRANFRLHDKYLTCDDSAYLLGGRNVGDLFLGDYAKKQNIDRDVLVLSSVRYEEGETASVNDVKAYFNAVWELSQNRAFSGKIAAKKKDRAEREMAARYAALKEKYPEISSPIDRESETLQARGVKLLHGDVYAAPKSPVLWKTIASALKGRDAVIQTPYAIMDNAMYEDIASIASSGGALRIVTNSVSSGANPWGCADSERKAENSADRRERYGNQRGEIVARENGAGGGKPLLYRLVQSRYAQRVSQYGNGASDRLPAVERGVARGNRTLRRARRDVFFKRNGKNDGGVRRKIRGAEHSLFQADRLRRSAIDHSAFPPFALMKFRPNFTKKS